MRKSSLVKAMACFMAATMAVTCVPGVNVTNGVAVVAEAAEETLNPVASYDFESELDYEGEAEIVNENGNKVLKIERSGAKTATIKNPFAGKENLAGITVSFDFYGLDCADHDVNSLDGLIGFTDGTDAIAITATPGIYLTGTHWYDFNSYRALNEKTHLYKTGVWKNITVTIDKSNGMTIYVGGNKIEPADGANAWEDGLEWKDVWETIEQLMTKEDSTLTFGQSPFWGTETGYIDNVKIFDRAVTSSEAKELSGVNNCTKIEFSNEDNITAVLNTPFDLTAKLTGEDSSKGVTEEVTAAAINADLQVKKESDGQEYILSVTPTKITTNGAVTVTCGSIGKTYHFNVVDNYCSELKISKGNAKVDNAIFSYTQTPYQTDSFIITAIGENRNAALNSTIKPIEKAGDFTVDNIKYSGTTGIAAAVGNPDTSVVGQVSQTFSVYVQEGLNIFAFECDGKEFVVEVTGKKGGSTDGSTSTGTPSSPSTDNTTTDTPTDDTPDTITPGGATPDTPSTDNNTPSTDNNTPSTDDNTPSTDDNTTSDGTETKTTKKKAKVASVTAKKGKKVVSGTVKISATGKKVKKATVKVYVNSKKKVTVKTKSTGKFTAKLSKKLKKGDKVKLVITKSTIKKITKTVTVK